MIPISTAISDPKWYHQNRGPQYTYFDKNNVINGLRCEYFTPGQVCQGLCYGPETCAEKGPENCVFLKAYRSQLELTVDLPQFLERCERAAQYVKDTVGYEDEPVIVLIVHEATDNPCSERGALIDYMTSHGFECQEWERE